MFRLMEGHSDQGRAFLRVDATLSRVAREKAADMASRGYYDHTDPDGHGPNWLVVRAGYALPPEYSDSPSANNVESLTAGRASATDAWSSWMGSSAHAQHVLGKSAFYAAQTSVGVGYVNDPGSTYTHYWVVITAPPSGPALAISSPAPDLKVTTPEAVFTGSTSGAPAAASVQTAVGSGPWLPAVGARNWTATVAGLQPGENAVIVRSLDAAGAVLDRATRTVRYVVMAPLTVQTSGAGSVSEKFAGTTDREVGRAYEIVATPAAGALFTGWTGSFSQSGAKLSFVMAPGVNVTANFAANPFVSRTGRYEGLFASGETHGEVRVKMDATGAFTTRVRYDGRKISLKGRFTPDGNATVSTLLPGGATLSLSLHLDLTGSLPQVTGTLTDGNFSAPFTIGRSGGAPGATSAYAGRYTLVIPALDDANPATPNGDGFGSLLVDADGTATFSGTLADGTKVLGSGFVTTAGTLALYLPLYENAGVLTGTVLFRANAGSDFDAVFFWKKPAGSTVSVGGAFSAAVPVLGSLYTAPAPGVAVLAVPALVNNTTLALGDGGLLNQLVQPTTLAQDNSVAVGSPVVSGVSVEVKTKSGRFKGKFVHPSTNATTKFGGVIFQKQNAGFGFFLGTSESGYTTFAPAGTQLR